MQKKVLIVDDEEDLTWSISKNLARDKELYDLICVNSGKEALSVLSQVPVDLVVSDIKMPEMTGLDLLLEIKEHYPRTKVIIMTAYGSQDIQQEASRRGSLHYIEKPFEIEELRTLIVNAITEKKGFEGQVSDFQLSDIIQMNCLGRINTALIVEKDNEIGTIYFEDGNIVHAEVGSLVGENALYEILSWEGGKFTSKRGLHTPKETINKGWQSLLLEGMRRKDEIAPESPEVKEEERMRRLGKINLSLNEIAKIKGVLLVGIVTQDGFINASILSKEGESKEFDLGALGLVISPALKYAESLSNELKSTGGMKQMMVECEDKIAFISNIPSRTEILLVVADVNTNLGGIRLEAKKQGQVLKDLL
jgi:CheY-like chemotaxis protein